MIFVKMRSVHLSLAFILLSVIDYHFKSCSYYFYKTIEPITLYLKSSVAVIKFNDSYMGFSKIVFLIDINLQDIEALILGKLSSYWFQVQKWLEKYQGLRSKKEKKAIVIKYCKFLFIKLNIPNQFQIMKS